MKIKQFFTVMCFGLIFSVLPARGMYLWELHQGGERSCCLSHGGVDICNPYVACTRHVYSDLMGINDYIARLLATEKASTFSYFKVLSQAQAFIRHALSSGQVSLYYRFDEQRSVQFFHEIQEKSKHTEKSTGKSGDSASKGASMPSDKQKADEAVLAYLVKMGLARQVK